MVGHKERGVGEGTAAMVAQQGGAAKGSGPKAVGHTGFE
jgi:hypothetical protein